MTRSHPPYRAQTVANYYIKVANREERHLSPMKLLKLVYFAQGWHLAVNGTPLIIDPVEAWEYGPVIPSLYHALKRYGSGHISEYLDTGDDPITVPESDEPTRVLLDAVWKAYGHYGAMQLSNITHMPGTPWYTVVVERNKGRVPHGEDIDTDLIRDYFLDIGERMSHAQ